ncbi:hypothetical protein DKW60_12620 [Leucothrix pacifica]|uniref:Uncharacterized protein n=2 Tax=Leucothrix pacifica TaxID=1247513 RepID=A0A317CEW1_9GAMM|nr:hypothetical protein DKW60_12620 [Leucothrix pacifica]
MKGKILWEKVSGNEWSFVGEGDDFNDELVEGFIGSFFQDPEVYFVIDRHNSFSVAREEAALKVKSALKDQVITLCNHSFSKMIEFHYIGVAKHGAVSS